MLAQSVNHEALAFLDGAHNGVSGNRPAARGELNRHTLGAADRNASYRVCLVAAVGPPYQPPRHHRGQALAQSDVGKQLAARADAAIAQRPLPGGIVDLHN
jgi:hypothetical protein